MLSLAAMGLAGSDWASASKWVLEPSKVSTVAAAPAALRKFLRFKSSTVVVLTAERYPPSVTIQPTCLERHGFWLTLDQLDDEHPRGFKTYRRRRVTSRTPGSPTRPACNRDCSPFLPGA